MIIITNVKNADMAEPINESLLNDDVELEGDFHDPWVLRDTIRLQANRTLTIGGIFMYALHRKPIVAIYGLGNAYVDGGGSFLCCGTADFDGLNHGVDVRESAEVRVHDLNVVGPGTDGFYVHGGRDVAFLRCKSHDAKRNGFTMAGGSDVVYSSCEAYRTIGNSPQAGFLVEPEWGQACKGVELDGCHAENNRGPAYMVNVTKLAQAGGVAFRKCRGFRGELTHPRVLPFRVISNDEQPGMHEFAAQFEGCGPLWEGQAMAVDVVLPSRVKITWDGHPVLAECDFAASGSP